MTAVNPMPWWKRAMDVSVASLMILFTVPLWAAIAIIIKIVSPGPVFFTQRRAGLRGQEFDFIKFRTMHAENDDSDHKAHMHKLIEAARDGEEPPMHKISNDPRIIPGGHVLRALCLDELPQLINVLRGDMSLVGPRPPVPYEVAEYDAWHMRRLDATPGMTGLWQVSGKNRLTFSEMTKLDIEYSETKSLFGDVMIMLRTPMAIMVSAWDGLRNRGRSS